jgi:aerobic carbon-monoxide dehydrogenase medium subunit
MSRSAQYARPRTLAQAAELLQGLGAGASVIAGGQELMPALNSGVFAPTVLVDIGRLPELAGIREGDGWLSIGALCVHREVERDPLVRRHAPLLAQALARVGGGWQVRQRGTIGGNVVCMHPLYDALPALLALGARARVQQGTASTVRPLQELVADRQHGLGTTAILVRLEVPLDDGQARWGFSKLKTTDGAYSSATAAALLRMDAQGRIGRGRLVITAVASSPIDASPVLAALEGRPAGEALLQQVQQACAALVREPHSDQRGGADYRRAMAGVAARRALEQAWGNTGATA